MSDPRERSATTPPAEGAHPPIFRPPPPPPRARAPLPPLEDDEPAEAPSARRESFEGLPTLPLDATVALDETPQPAGEAQPAVPELRWAPPPEKPREGLAGLALGLAVLALVASFFVGWGLPVALVAVLVAVAALRRPAEPRPPAVWALVLGLVALVYSAGWLLWTASQLRLWG